MRSYVYLFTKMTDDRYTFNFHVGDKFSQILRLVIWSSLSQL